MTRLFAAFAAVFAASVASASNIGSPITADGYTFTNFDFPNSGNAAASGSNANGIANNGAVAGFSINDNGAFTNFVRNSDGTFTALNLASPQAQAFGINSAGDVVGQQNGAAFFLPAGGSLQNLTTLTGPAAFGINDQGNIVGQLAVGNESPGFFLASSASNSLTVINSASGPNTVFAQGVNANGRIVGFYVGNDGQDHGFDGNIQNANGGALTGTPVADPIIPNVPGEPGATFIFSQILGVSDSGLAVGYYGDSTTSQHGFLYNTNTGVYSFLDDPAEQFDDGVEITQITGINNSDEITGFYSDASGVFHGFAACPAGMSCSSPSAAVPEPASPILASFGLAVFGFSYFRRGRRNRQASLGSPGQRGWTPDSK